MNNLIKYSLVAALSFGCSGISLAAIINDGGVFNNTDVGFTDFFIAEGGLQGNPANETTWVNLQLAPIEVTFTVKDEGGADGVPYFSTDTAGVFAFHFDPLPGDEYYLIKNSQGIALFQNLADMDWGVFDTNLLSAAMNLPTDPFFISHVTRFDGPGTGGDNGNVPEPTSLLLIGTGLLGLFGATRKKA